MTERGRHPGASTILHADMDAFFASVELLRRPELRGKPVIVGGDGRRGVVAAASYEARSFGIHSAMPSSRARRLCPHAVFLPGDHAHYRDISARVMAIFGSFTPKVEPLSLDEAFLDVTGARRLFGEGVDIGHRLRNAVFEAEGLWCSVGVAPTKFLSKLASEAAKPAASRGGPVPGSGVKVVAPGEELDFLRPMPAKALWGVGPKTLEKLERIGISTVAHLADTALEQLIAALGNAQGRHLHDLANGRDPRSVETGRATKSISHEETFATDRFGHDELKSEVVRLSDAVAGRVRRAGLTARTVTIKVRFGSFATITRSSTLERATSSRIEILRAAEALLAGVDVSGGVRLFGVGVAQLAAEGAHQLSIDDALGPDWTSADAAIDAVRERFGDAAIGPAALAQSAERQESSSEATPWGPNERS